MAENTEPVEGNVVLQQLKKTRAHLSIWELLCASGEHRRAMVEALSKIIIPEDANPVMFVRSVQKEALQIAFSDEELPAEGRNHNRPLFIRAEVKGKKTSCVMVDDGSSINVCPLKILTRLGIKSTDMNPSSMTIKDYDDSKRGVEGTFVAIVKVGPIEDEVEFTVLNIPATFALLLGRPWFHKLEGVPSTLHQMIKFPYGGEIITIRAEVDNAVATLEIQPFARFQISVTFEEWVDPKVAQIMEKMKFEPGQGSTLPNFKGQNTRRGLGYRSDEDKPKAKKKGLKLMECFVKALGYQGEPEPVVINGVVVPRFEIFQDILGKKKKSGKKNS